MASEISERNSDRNPVKKACGFSQGWLIHVLDRTMHLTIEPIKFSFSQCPFLGIFVQKIFFIQKAVNLSSKSLSALTKQVSTCFEDFMNISWFYLIKVKFSGHFWPYTLNAPSCTWFLMIGKLVGLKLFITSWVWVHICAPVKFLTFFPTWASNRNLIFQAKLQNSLCSCTSWGYMCNTNEICDTYPESSWYKLLKNARKSWNNHKSYCTLLDNFGQKCSKTDTVDRPKKMV